MSFSGGLYLTNSGRLALSKVQADSTKTLHFTKFAFGDGALNGGLEIERTSLVNRKDTSNITRLRVNGDNTCTVGTKRLGNAVGGYYLREIGLYAKDPDNGNNEILYGYANAGDDAQYIPASGGAEIVEKTINIIISISNGASVTATLSTGVYVTPEEFEAHVNDKNNPHGVTAAQISAAEADHTHGAITNNGKIGKAANKAVFTGEGGALKAGTLPIAAGARTLLRQTWRGKTSMRRKSDLHSPTQVLLHRRGWQTKHIRTIRTALPFRSQALRLRALPKSCYRLLTLYPVHMRLCAKHMQAVYICMPTPHPARL